MAKYTQGKTNAPELAQAFFKRMQDNAPQMYKSLERMVHWFGEYPSFIPNETYAEKYATDIEQAKEVLVAIDKGHNMSKEVVKYLPKTIPPETIELTEGHNPQIHEICQICGLDRTLYRRMFHLEDNDGCGCQYHKGVK